MYSLIRKAIFSLDPETAHDLVIKSLHFAGKSPCQFLLKQLLACPQGTPKQVMGITFKNNIMINYVNRFTSSSFNNIKII